MMRNPEGDWEGLRARDRMKQPSDIDKISPEDVDPTFELPTQRTPEEELIAKREGLDEEDWQDWLEELLYETDVKKQDQEQAHTEQNEFPWEKKEQDTEYRRRLDELVLEFEKMGDGHEAVQALVDKFHLPNRTTGKDIEKLVAYKKHPKTGRSYGPWGREEKNKHKKGGETIRRPQEDK